jgi:hypothetical protein
MRGQRRAPVVFVTVRRDRENVITYVIGKRDEAQGDRRTPAISLPVLARRLHARQSKNIGFLRGMAGLHTLRVLVDDHVDVAIVPAFSKSPFPDCFCRLVIVPRRMDVPDGHGSCTACALRLVSWERSSRRQHGITDRRHPEARPVLCTAPRPEKFQEPAAALSYSWVLRAARLYLLRGHVGLRRELRCKLVHQRRAAKTDNGYRDEERLMLELDIVGTDPSESS